MTTRTEAALVALLAALAGAAEASEALPAPTRNLALDDILEALAGGAGGHLNLVDGTGRPGAVQLGTPPTYEIDHEAELEWIVQDADQAARDAASDAGLEAIAAVVEALNAAMETGAYDGVLDHVEIVEVDRSNLSVFGAPQLKGVTVSVRLSFTSARPF